MSLCHAGDRLTRRNRVILAFSLALGVGVTLVPQWASNALWDCSGCSAGVEGLRDALITVLETGTYFCDSSVALSVADHRHHPTHAPCPASLCLPSSIKVLRAWPVSHTKFALVTDPAPTGLQAFVWVR